jgi:vacuolar-type H+-ATPase subunit I/STV1
MAMTEQQKAGNKAAQAVRDRAYAARSKQHRSAVEAAENSAEVLQAREAFDEAAAVFSVMLESQHSQISSIKQQIAALEAQIEGLRRSPELQALGEERRAAATAWNKIKAEKIAQADAMFPDLAGSARYSVTGWQPPQDVLDAMEQARKTATPKPKAA